VTEDAMPVQLRQLPSGAVLVDAPVDEPPFAVALCARVSNHDPRNDLDRPLARLSQYAADHDLHVGESVAEVGSGLNGKCRKLLRLLSEAKIGSVVNDDLVPDTIAVFTSSCAPWYGRRSARNRATSIERALAREPHT
jgi:putative resolvase